jgi:hypothetical protein
MLSETYTCGTAEVLELWLGCRVAAADPQIHIGVRYLAGKKLEMMEPKTGLKTYSIDPSFCKCQL